jgi:hypothetical protein
LAGGARFSFEKREEVEGEVAWAGATRLIGGADLLAVWIGPVDGLADSRELPIDSRRLTSSLNSASLPSRYDLFVAQTKTKR